MTDKSWRDEDRDITLQDLNIGSDELYDDINWYIDKCMDDSEDIFDVHARVLDMYNKIFGDISGIAVTNSAIDSILSGCASAGYAQAMRDIAFTFDIKGDIHDEDVFSLFKYDETGPKLKFSTAGENK